LRRAHLAKIIETCRDVKSLVGRRGGTPYAELQSPVIFGVLAHSHGWSNREFPELTVLERIEACVLDKVEQPWELPDVFCIANTANYSLTKSLAIAPHIDIDSAELFPEEAIEGGVVTCYFARYNTESARGSTGVVLGALVATVTHLLAQENPALRSYADYMLTTGSIGGGIGRPVAWRPDALSAAVRSRLRKRGYDEDAWSEWRRDVV
jgi:hypothetical protein